MSEPNEMTERERRLDAILGRYFDDQAQGRGCTVAELLARHPELADDLRAFFADAEASDRLIAQLGLARARTELSSPPVSTSKDGRAQNGSGPGGTGHPAPGERT